MLTIMRKRKAEIVRVRLPSLLSGIEDPGIHDNSHAIPSLLLTRAGGEAQVRECHDVLS